MSTNDTEVRRYDATALAVVRFDKDVRSAPPRNRYAPIANFPGESTGWSVGMEFLVDLDHDGWVKIAKIDLLAEDAPHYRLVEGTEFVISEGPIEVGRVEVVSASDLVPDAPVVDGEDLPRRVA